MVYAFVQDMATSWEQYERVARGLTDPTPPGLILHLAGQTDEGVRIIVVWDREQAWQRFQAERLQPAIAALGGPAQPEPTFRDLLVTHLVLGPGQCNRNASSGSPMTRATVSPAVTSGSEP